MARTVSYGLSYGLGRRVAYRVPIRRPSRVQRLGRGRYGSYPLITTNQAASRLQSAYRAYRLRSTTARGRRRGLRGYTLPRV